MNYELHARTLTLTSRHVVLTVATNLLKMTTSFSFTDNSKHYSGQVTDEQKNKAHRVKLQKPRTIAE